MRHFSYFLLFSLLPLFSYQSTIRTPDFCYEGPNCGPSSPRWSGLCKTGSRQSPINISPTIENTLFETRIETYPTFSGYRVNNFWILNNGHSIKVSFHSDLRSPLRTMELSGDTYIFAQLHFHWGTNLTEGSEHTLDGKHFPMELHMVHYNSKYKNFSEALASDDDPKALAVVGVFLDTILSDDERTQSSSTFTLISNNLPKIYQVDPVLVNEELNLAQILPLWGDTIFKYPGSLTTPGCKEIVQWILLRDPIYIEEEDYWNFHLVQNEKNEFLAENYRPTQLQGNRIIETVYFHKNKFKTHSGMN